MMRNSFFLKIFTLAALFAFFASPAAAERLQQRNSRGNNLGMTVGTGWGMPWTGSWRGSLQFPKGSGNHITNDGMTIGVGAAQDLNGDGVPEDTSGLEHLRATMGALASLESIDLLTQMAAGGANMEGEPARIEYNRIWTSLDADELADWPREGRIPRGDPNGVPNVAAGGETIFFHSSEVFNSWGYSKAPCGVYFAWTLRFLDFAESNNMLYGNIFCRNMSEYVKWNPNSTYKATGQANPNGWKWHGMIVISNNRNMEFGGNAAGWALHMEKGITGFYSKVNTISGWTPASAPVMGFKMINPPKFGDEQMQMTALHTVDWGSEFGFSGTKQIFVGFPWGQAYKAALDLPQEPRWYPGSVNPFNGREILGAWPGHLVPEDSRYSQWIWGGPSNFMIYPCYGELHNIAPRDTVNFDFAYMLTYPPNPTYIVPDMDIDNIDDPGMQLVLSPLEHYAEVAEIVINSGFQLPSTPLAPTLTIIPGDRQVTITWSDVNLQTPDSYYSFLEANNLNPDGLYQEYDFEGYRVYRSFVGPSDSHSELLADFSRSAGNLQFYYIDRLEDDKPFLRMRNGLKVWYAVVPYDMNYDAATGEMFSLPDLSSGKTWNRPGEALYTVLPRSEASNFKPATFESATFLGTGAAPEPLAELGGDGSGKLTEAPKLLEPPFDFTFEAINNERITQDLTIYVACTGLEVDWGCSYWAYPQRVISLLDGSNNVLYMASPFLTRDATAEIVLMNKGDASGINYAVHALWDHPGSAGNRDYAPVYIDFNTGGYAGATVANQFGSCQSSRVGTGPSIGSYIRTGVFELTWKSAGGGLSVDVTDKLRGESVPFSPYREDKAWGFMSGGTYMDFFDEVKAGTSKAERANLMLETIPADNTDEFAISINGIVWAFTDLTAMPSSGTVMTITNAFGAWNGDKTVFTQYADAPYPGDKWEIKIKAMSLDPEDADLSRVKVVPNPYMASTFLDLSATHRRIEFVNLPSECTIRIFTLSGNLVNVLNHIGASREGWGNYTDWDRLSANEPAVYTGYDNHGGTEPWNLCNRFGQTVASGLYFFHVTDSRGKTYTGKFYIIL
ncbi:MAG TPA: hypothetical protein VM123_14290 [archaeon]|nr:hypothetical protein [archaeon]